MTQDGVFIASQLLITLDNFALNIGKDLSLPNDNISKDPKSHLMLSIACSYKCYTDSRFP